MSARRYHRIYTRRSAAERKAITTASQQARPKAVLFFVPEAVHKYYIATHIQAKNKHISVYNAYSYSYTAISAKQHRGQINTVKQREAEQATEQEAPKAKRNGLNPYILKALRASGLP